MRNTIRTYVLAFSLIAALASSASATPKTGNQPGGFFTSVKNFIIHLLDDSKIVYPTG
jgi:hypothetical protein